MVNRRKDGAKRHEMPYSPDLFVSNIPFDSLKRKIIFDVLCYDCFR